MMHRDKIHDNDLLDYYGSLLTKRQNEVMQMYIEEDLSMQEIADVLTISKQAVQDIITRTYKTLDSYEDKLKMIHLENRRAVIYRKILAYTNDDVIKELVDKLKDIK